MNRRGATSNDLFQAAQALLPGGVSSPVRAFRAVGGTPPFIERGAGPEVWDADGNRYIDYVGAWGPQILGHAAPVVVDALCRQAGMGTGFGAPHRLEVELARRLTEVVPGLERVRFVNSGTEATMSAIRLARAHTGRAAILTFRGCYHGHADALLVQAGSGVATLGLPDSPGVPQGAVADTLKADFNNLVSARAAVAARPGELAAIIVEPVAGNMGLVLPEPDFLPGLRELADENGALLIFDEVMTGFRVSFQGAGHRFGVVPDLVTLGKVIGGGLPVGAYGGRSELMAMVAPEGPVYQAGTLSGNPLVMAAGCAVFDALSGPGVYEQLEETSGQLAQGVLEAARRAGVEVATVSCGGLWGVFFHAGKVVNYDDARATDDEVFTRWFAGMLEAGIYLPPSRFEAAFVSTAHGSDEVAETLRAAERVLTTVARR